MSWLYNGRNHAQAEAATTCDQSVNLWIVSDANGWPVDGVPAMNGDGFYVRLGC